MHDTYPALTFLRHNRPLRALMLDNQPWFVAVDFARLLGMQHPQTLHRRVGSDHARRVFLACSSSLEEPVDVISEAGLYKALVRFGHPENAHLERWLTREVIPTLRDAHAADGNAPRRVLLRWQGTRVVMLNWQGELWVPLEDMPSLVHLG
ncbi:BRO-N domain-containing protein [Metapseudomonas otitidis]|uniref:BRO-N domain-containing protein n=1 Tax=Metapseudomonas otitidis TaxID=319939 RepID=UPI0013F5FF5E|nr:BRO family protein [Pseudomonas otitidis]